MTSSGSPRRYAPGWAARPLCWSDPALTQARTAWRWRLSESGASSAKLFMLDCIEQPVDVFPFIRTRCEFSGLVTNHEEGPGDEED